jgi:hypothetical protein
VTRSRLVSLTRESCRLVLGVSRAWGHFQSTAQQKYSVAVDLLKMPLLKDFPKDINHYANEGS